MMKLGMKIGTLLVCLLIATTVALPQDAAKGPAEQPVSHLRIDFLLNEYNGQQKVSSLPYSIFIAAASGGVPSRRNGSIRMGVKVPIVLSENGAGLVQQFEYDNIGTDIDCMAKANGDDSYDLDVTVDRTSLYAGGAAAADPETQALRSAGNRPVIQSFRTNFPLSMRNGETQEGTSATDPFNGHVLKVSVTLHVVK